MSNPKHGKGEKSPYRQLRPTLEWARVDAALMREFVSRVTASGYLAGFGTGTRGTSLVVSVVTNGMRDAEYANSYEDVYAVMQDLLWRNDIDPMAGEPE